MICLYICIYLCIFVYIFVYLCIFLYIRTYLQKMRRAICDKKSLTFHEFSLTLTNFPKFSKKTKIFKCSKTSKIDIS